MLQKQQHCNLHISAPPTILCPLESWQFGGRFGATSQKCRRKMGNTSFCSKFCNEKFSGVHFSALLTCKCHFRLKLIEFFDQNSFFGRRFVDSWGTEMCELRWHPARHMTFCRCANGATLCEQHRRRVFEGLVNSRDPSWRQEPSSHHHLRCGFERTLNLNLCSSLTKQNHKNRVVWFSKQNPTNENDTSVEMAPDSDF